MFTGAIMIQDKCFKRNVELKSNIWKILMMTKFDIGRFTIIFGAYSLTFKGSMFYKCVEKALSVKCPTLVHVHDGAFHNLLLVCRCGELQQSEF